MRDALVSMAARATTSTAADWLCSAISHLTDNDVAAKRLFATPEMRDALTSLSDGVASDDAAKRLAGTIYCISSAPDDSTKLLFSTDEVRDALMKAAGCVTSLDAMQWVTAAMTHLSLSQT
jgi:hypothetical protein